MKQSIAKAKPTKMKGKKLNLSEEQESAIVQLRRIWYYIRNNHYEYSYGYAAMNIVDRAIMHVKRNTDFEQPVNIHWSMI